jgi:DICT domain-containing protein
MWEARYGFPDPERLASGHRRYSERDLERIRAVLRARASGLPLAMAIERARRQSDEPAPSVFAALRDRFPHLHPHLLPKRTLIHISRAIEDEAAARAPHPILFGCFQQERFYRQSEERWRELARSAYCAIVMADFAGAEDTARTPAEVPLPPDDPLLREWVVVCEAPELSACLCAWERPRLRDEPRRFETVWTTEPEVVREAARTCTALAARHRPDLVSGIRDWLAEPPTALTTGALRAAVELATRVALYASGPSRDL